MPCPACGYENYKYFRRQRAEIQGVFGEGKASETIIDTSSSEAEPQRVECCNCAKTYALRHAREMRLDGEVPPNDLTFTPPKRS